MANVGDGNRFGCSGRMFPAAEIALIREVVATCRGLSRRELANTISELVGWTRPNGSLKEAECLRLLARLEAAGLLSLPAKQPTRPVGSVTSIPHTAAGEPGVPLSGRVERFAPVCVERVADAGARQRFRELVGRYHTLGYKVPFGAHLQYLVSITQPVPTVVGGLQFSSAAWRMQARDRWIGWDDATRARHLPQVVNNSRLLLPLGADKKFGECNVGPRTPAFAGGLAGPVRGHAAAGGDLGGRGAVYRRLLSGGELGGDWGDERARPG